MATLAGLVLIVFGIIYLVNPGIFRRGVWMKTSIAVRTMTPEQYKTYMRVLGGIFIGAGLILLVIGLS